MKRRIVGLSGGQAGEEGNGKKKRKLDSVSKGGGAKELKTDKLKANQKGTVK